MINSHLGFGNSSCPFLDIYSTHGQTQQHIQEQFAALHVCVYVSTIPHSPPRGCLRLPLTNLHKPSQNFLDKHVQTLSLIYTQRSRIALNRSIATLIATLIATVSIVHSDWSLLQYVVRMRNSEATRHRIPPKDILIKKT